MEAWLASIEPRVIDNWITYYGVEPESFHEGRRPDTEQPHTEWATPDQAADFFAKRLQR